MYAIEFCYRCQPDTFHIIRFDVYEDWISANNILSKAKNILVVRGYKMGTSVYD